MDWITHEEDVWFDFRGSAPEQLKPGRYYKGIVDGYADFGVFVNLAQGVTGLLHRSELDRRLESLDWEPGDEVFVQVKNVRDNGNIDLGWSIRQTEREFRGARVHDPEGDADGERIEPTAADDSGPVRQRPKGATSRRSNGETTDDDSTDEQAAEAASSSAAESVSASETESEAEAETDADAEAETDADADVEETTDTTDDDRVTVGSLDDRVGDAVSIEGRIVDVRQTGGPTVFQLRDETGIVDCAAFVEAGVRAYPGVDVGDAVRIDGEVERRRGELQVETEDLTVLEGDAAATVADRLAAALTDRARPEAVEALSDHAPIEALSDRLLDAAEAVRRAVLESRPIVVRHTATADGYVAGAAIERAVLPLIREEYDTSDAEYHYFTRRPLDDTVYGMNAATNDVTRLLEDNARHDEKVPLVLLVGTGSTVESSDGLSLLGIYDVARVVVDAEPADPDVADVADVLVDPDADDADDLSTGALCAALAATINADVADDLTHLPAVSYWEDAPAVYTDLAAEAGFDAERVRELREAVALEAYYQSYQDKRELITDLLFEDGTDDDTQATAPDGAAPRGLASHVAEQFRIKLDDEVEVAEANLETRTEDGVEFAVIDTDAFTHRFDFPPTTLLLDELHRRNRDGDFVTVGIGMDELYLRSTTDLDIRAVAAAAREAAPEAGITALGVRDGRIEFLSGERDDAVDAVVEAAAAQFD